jgi:hypothetical protein
LKPKTAHSSCRGKPTPPAPGEENCRCQNHFGMDDRAIRLAKNQFCRILKTMSAQETLIEEIRRQPEPVVREVLHYLKFLERQRAQEDWADVLPSREVEQEKLDILDGK